MIQPSKRIALQPIALSVMLAGGLVACAAETSEGSGQDDFVAGLEQRIVGAVRVPADTVERLGLVQIDNFCSGVLVGTRTVLTAVHCGAGVGTPIHFSGVDYTAVESFEPPSQFDTPWGPRDVEVLRLDRDVVYPGTNTAWVPDQPIWEFNLEAQIGSELTCFGAGPSRVVDGRPTGNDSMDYFAATRTIVNVEDGVAYRIEAGLEYGDSGGPCFAPIWWNDERQLMVMSISGSSVRDVFDDGSEGVGLSAAVTATGEAGITAWINSHL